MYAHILGSTVVKNKQYLFLALTGLCFLCLSLRCNSHDVSALPTLTVVTELSPPNQTYSNGVVGGTSTGLVQELLQLTGLKASYQIYPWARAFKVASEQANTLIYSIARTSLRERHFHWIGPVAKFELGFVTNTYRNDVIVNSLEDAKKYRLAIQRGDIAVERLKEYGFDYVLTSDITQSYQLLVTNKVDLVLDDPRYVKSMADTLNLPKGHFRFLLSVPNLSLHGYLAANIHTPDEVIKKLRIAFEGIKRTQAYQEVLTGYH
ncbi:hypothetical protein PSECIP111951_02414 [Pseudoalteromonas holothuriae]|uniref:Solute-binding protein family 3/N-terminal domain-containing protein n=1 Tax=Pseudoalteromonas holothuriae TaxID=2963714 RepID=A0ABM9GKE4_9GAMM|nr:hypothetical protein PSECIP111951_02414 [Pseudoalteromonas sp. CIP111951]